MDLFYYLFPKIRPFLEVINTVALIWIVVLLKQLADGKKNNWSSSRNCKGIYFN